MREVELQRQRRMHELTIMPGAGFERVEREQRAARVQSKISLLSSELSRHAVAAAGSRVDVLALMERQRQMDAIAEASMMMRLFKALFGSVTLFPPLEVVLRSHICRIVQVSLRGAATSEVPENYYVLLRSLFRSIGGGKFEHLYRELMPMLPGLMHGLLALERTADDPTLRRMLLELCLTLPARLQSLLPHLPSLMHPVIQALRSNHVELVGA